MKGEKLHGVLGAKDKRQQGEGDMKTATGIQRQETKAEEEGAQCQLDNPGDLRSIPQ